MRTIETTVYTINELSKGAQQKAHEKYLNGGFDINADEMVATLKAFCNVFDLHLKDYSLSSDRCDISVSTFGIKDEILQVSGIRLAAYLWNNYRNDLFKGKFYSTKVNTIDGKLSYKKRYSRCQLEANCVLTDVCFDEIILSPIYRHLITYDKNTTFEYLLQDCISDFESMCKKELEYQESFEQFAEMAESNGFEFTEDGRLA